ncbi:MAG TPA: hypothetical protein DCL77_18780 [Prolixibacteraceae bacterium]|jgi:hypothetical protein|nr:hypothetical protein [Prolixibacteraceae bacterium]
MKKLYFLAFALFVSFVINAQTVIYSNNFESANGVGDATIVGTGKIETSNSGGFGHVFHNAVGGQAIRSNYLLLPSNIFANLQNSGSKEFSIAFWVNKGTAIDNFWTPIFSAYGAAPIGGANTWPMMILQSRMVAQVNCAGWTDFIDADNTNALNVVSTSWLDDAAWHYYTATFTETSVKVYIDGVVQNSWTCTAGIDGKTVSGLFTNGADLKYICLGGNQAWGWGDVDPAYLFDDISIYSNALTVDQINAKIASKLTTAINVVNVGNKLVGEEYFSLSGIKVGYTYNNLKAGIYIKKSVYSNGAIVNTKIMKEVQ